MLPTLLLLVGLSSTVNLGERPPGLVGQAVLAGDRWQVQATIDTADKSSGAGWLLAHVADIAVGPGVLIGAEYRVRDGGGWAKQTGWVRAGYVRAWGRHSLVVVGRAALVGDTLGERAAQVEYRHYAGRWVLATTQGLVWYRQAGLRCGYMMMASAGLALWQE